MFKDIGGSRKVLYQVLFVAVVVIICYWVVASRNIPKVVPLQENITAAPTA